MMWLIGILGLAFMVCMTILIAAKMDNKHEIKKAEMEQRHRAEREKLEILKRNPELFAKVFKV